MRTVPWLLSCLLLGAPPQVPDPSKAAAQNVPVLHGHSLEVGLVGTIHQYSNLLFYQVDHVISPKEFVAVAVSPGRGYWKYHDHMRFVVRGLDAGKLADKKPVELVGVFKVTGTTKVGLSTLFVVEPETPAEKEKREAAAKAKADEARSAADRDLQVRQEAERKEAVEREAKAKAERDRKNDPKEKARQREADAQAKLKLTKTLLDDRANVKTSVIRERLQKILADYPDTEAAKEARQLLDKL